MISILEELIEVGGTKSCVYGMLGLLEKNTNLVERNNRRIEALKKEDGALQDLIAKLAKGAS